MSNPKKRLATLFLLVLLLVLINYDFLDKSVRNFLDERESVRIERVIDGDTVVTSDGVHVRLLGINTPEKSEKYSSEAKNFLWDIVMNKSIELRYGKEKEDRYGRTLGYLFDSEQNINLQIVENGFANYYFPSGRDVYYNEFKEAWENCINRNVNLCKKSEDKCSRCIELQELSVEKQEVIFYNNCNFDCSLKNWTIKDEGRKKFVFQEFVLEGNKEVKIIVGNRTDSENILYWKNKDYVWTSSGDTLFLRDSGGDLVLWESW